MTERKKLIEVALPLEAINDAAAAESSNPFLKGHPKSLKWWARRPLAACRAVVFASIVDDPLSDPERFPTEEAQLTERDRLFALISELVRWENTNNEALLSQARREIEKAGPPPPLLDPFAGGGSIPLEAQRLGLSVVGSDLNPVAVLITKALTQVASGFGDLPPAHPETGTLSMAELPSGLRGLAADIRHYGRVVSEKAERRLSSLYPPIVSTGGGETSVSAWIWARTVRSPNPAWAAPVPLVRSFVLSSRQGKEVWVEPTVDHDSKRISFAIRHGKSKVAGTVGRTGATCLATGSPVPFEYIREEGRAGRLGMQLIAIVLEGKGGRQFIAATPEQEEAALAVPAPEDLPATELPTQALGFRVQNYGMTRHVDLFSNRQLMALATFCDEVRNIVPEIANHARASADKRLAKKAEAYAAAVALYLAQAVARMAMFNNTLCKWNVTNQNVANPFGMQTLSMTWDFVESSPIRSAAGIGPQVESVAEIVETSIVAHANTADVQQRDAMSDRGDRDRFLIITDPPYYDNVGYADLSDFFFVWLRRMLRDTYPEECSTLLTPKTQELIADPARHNGVRAAANAFFESGFRDVFAWLHLAMHPDYPMSVMYAFKQSEEGEGGTASTGWETMLSGLVASGLSVVGTWPMRTERQARVRGQSSNALATSVVLICRPRSEHAPLASRKEFVAALKAELPNALRRLQYGNIAPVDLAQAAIGPGMAVFSRYAKVIEADGSAMSVRIALGLINQVLDETLAEQEADFDPDTRWAVAWFEQYGMNAGPFGVAETLSKAKNTAVNGLVMAGILESKAGKVRLLERDELPDMWDPSTDTRLTVWEVTQHLLRSLESGGEGAAASLLRQVGGLGETARELAYRLYVVCERKKWAKEALAFNGLVLSWPEISRLAATAPTFASATQQELL